MSHSLTVRSIALLVALAMASPVLAQDGDEPIPVPDNGSRRRRDGRDPVRMGGGGDPAPGDSDADETERKPTAEQRSEPELLVEQLGEWPSNDARQASIRLAAQPSIAYPLLEQVLLSPDADWRQIAGSAATLGKMRELRALELIQAKLQDRKMYQHSGELLDALVRIDPVHAKRRLIAELLHPAGAVVRAAAERLAERVSQAELPDLVDVYEAGGGEARAQAVQLMAAADLEAARPHLVKALGDKDPQTSLAAAEALARDPSEAAEQALLDATAAPVDRMLAFAYLGLGLRQTRAGRRLITDDHVRTLMGTRGLKSLNPLNRAAAAIVLADTGYAYAVEKLDVALDREVMPVLVDTWGGTEFWRDMEVLRPMALRRLQRLSGDFERTDPKQWWSWWERHRDAFVARRVLSSIPPEQVGELVLTVTGEGAPGGESTILTPSVYEVSGTAAGRLPLLLSTEEAAELARVVEESGLLAVREGLTGALDQGGPLTLHVRVGKRQRLVRVRAEDPAPEARPVLEQVRRLRELNDWQRYRDAVDPDGIQQFVQRMGEWFDPALPASERARAKAALIVASVGGDRTDDWNLRALRELAELGDAQALLDPADREVLLALLTARDRADPIALALIEVLAGIQDVEVSSRLLTFLQTRRGPRTADLMARVLSGAGDAAHVAALDDDAAEVRRAALRALERGDFDGKAGEYALLGLADTDPDVRREAVLAIGRLRVDGAMERLTALASEPGPLRTAAVEGLGRLGGKEVLPELMRAFTDDDPGVRVAAVQALAATREPEAFSAIVFGMSSDLSPLVREVASQAIVEIGTDRAGQALRLLALDPSRRPGPRARAVAGWSDLLGRRAHVDLERLLSDAATEVADEAAIALARWREPAGVPRLLEMLYEGRQTARAVQALESLSLESFGQDDAEILADLYTGWWDLESDRGPRRWLMDRLTLEGLEDEGLRRWADGEASREAVPALLDGLRSEYWYIRRACDLALRQILGESVGWQEPWTTRSEAADMRRAWERVWAGRTR